MADCTLCRIVAGEADAHVLHRDDEAVAFLDARPAVDGHTLVVPTAHHESLFAAEESTIVAVFRAARTVARAMDRALDPDGFSLFHTSGDFVGTVDHAHVHLLPREADDPVHVALERKPLDGDAAGALAERVRVAL